MPLSKSIAPGDNWRDFKSCRWNPKWKRSFLTRQTLCWLSRHYWENTGSKWQIIFPTVDPKATCQGDTQDLGLTLEIWQENCHWALGFPQRSCISWSSWKTPRNGLNFHHRGDRAQWLLMTEFLFVQQILIDSTWMHSRGHSGFFCNFFFPSYIQDSSTNHKWLHYWVLIYSRNPYWGPLSANPVPWGPSLLSSRVFA